MANYTGFEYLLIDICNQGHDDKLLFEERIQWTLDHMDQLEAHTANVAAKDMPMYVKAVQTLRKAQQGLPTGHLIGLDAVCSGVQIMSVLTGCYEAAKATGLVDPNRRADAYTQTTKEMKTILGPNFDVSRPDAKLAFMSTFYGSSAKPKEVYGEDTPELDAFYEAAVTVAPGPWELLQDLISSWNPNALVHQWKLPDGYDAVVKVMVKKTNKDGTSPRIEVDELDHASFTYEYSVNECSEYGLSNAANCVHSVDAWVLRSMHRRCNYDEAMVKQADLLILDELMARATGDSEQLVSVTEMIGKIGYYRSQYERSTVADVVILPYLDACDVQFLSTEHLEALHAIVTGMLAYKPFELITIHDEFRALGNNLNHVRNQYKAILAELADSSLLDDLLSQLYGEPRVFKKLSADLSSYIRGSAYALC